MASLSQQILNAFGGGLNDKVLEECVTICKLYSLTPEDLFFKWEAARSNFSTPFQTQTKAVFDMEAVVSLKATLNRALNDKKKQTPKMNRMMAGAATMSRTRMPMFGRNANQFKAPSTPTPKVKREEVDLDVGMDMLVDSAPTDAPSKVVFRGPPNDAEEKKKRSYRYMYETVSERSTVLSEQIASFGRRIMTYYHLDGLGDPGATTDEEVVVVGRITQDNEQTTSTKLTENTLIIDASREHHSQRVPIRFSPSVKIRRGAKSAGTWGLFPGAIVALRGKNGGGGWFSVTEILAPPPLRTRSVQEKADQDATRSAFTACVFCGPYTSDNDLDFKAWRVCLPTLRERKPNVVILLGPFIDATHKSIKAGDIDCSPLQLFHKRFTKEIRAYLDSSPGSIAVLVPSVRDLIGSQAVYPQGEFQSEVSNGDPRIRLVPNPASFSLNDVTFGITSVETVFHLKSQEVTIGGEDVESLDSELPEDIDGMANACRHLLQQRSFYPVFPVPAEESERVNLDVKHADGLSMRTLEGEYAPDVLVVPNRLKQFAKNLEGTVAINPGFVTKGSCALLEVGSGSGLVKERIKVEIIKVTI